MTPRLARVQSRPNDAWVTPVQESGVGFPDILALRAERILVAELKSVRGRLKPEQEHWLEAFERAGAETYVWRPADWLGGEIVEVLR